MQSNTVYRGDLNCSAHDIFHFLNFAVQLLVKFQNLLEGSIECCSLRSKAELFLIAIDDQHVVMCFHCLKLLTYCRLKSLRSVERLSKNFLVSTKSQKVLKFCICIRY